MKKYFIEFGPQHNRTFINRPPQRPLGPIKEITEEQWEKLKDIHPNEWKLKNNQIITKSYKIGNSLIKSSILQIAIFLLGIIVGFIIK